MIPFIFVAIIFLLVGGGTLLAQAICVALHVINFLLIWVSRFACLLVSSIFFRRELASARRRTV